MTLQTQESQVSTQTLQKVPPSIPAGQARGSGMTSQELCRGAAPRPYPDRPAAWGREAKQASWLWMQGGRGQKDTVKGQCPCHLHQQGHRAVTQLLHHTCALWCHRSLTEECAGNKHRCWGHMACVTAWP